MTSVISKSKVRLFLVAALLLCFISVTAYAEDHAPAAVTEETAPCKGLKPFSNIDELLYQFYVNLDSDCLFEMPVADLEEAWGIKILDKSIPPEEYHALLEGSEFRWKPYKTEKDAFFIQVHRNKFTENNEFKITITHDYDERHGTLFPDGNFPKLISQRPIRRPVFPSSACHRPLMFMFDPIYPIDRFYRPKEPGVYCGGFWKEFEEVEYYWLSSDQTRMLRFVGPCGLCEGVINIALTDQVESRYLTNINNVKE